MVPASIVAKALIDLGKQPKKEDVAYVLNNSGDVAIVLRSEDKLLLKSKMPSNWEIGDSTFARYTAAGVKIVDNYWVKRNKIIYR